MNRKTPWAWTGSGLALDRQQDGSLEQLWLCPDLPPAWDRSAHPVGVEVFCWFADTAKLNEGLLALWEAFGRDSVLVAIFRRDDSSRVLVYTAARESVAHERYYAVRGTLRPTAMGVRVFDEPGWDALAELLASLGEKRSGADAAPGDHDGGHGAVG